MGSSNQIEYIVSKSSPAIFNTMTFSDSNSNLSEFSTSKISLNKATTDNGSMMGNQQGSIQSLNAGPYNSYYNLKYIVH